MLKLKSEEPPLSEDCGTLQGETAKYGSYQNRDEEEQRPTPRWHGLVVRCLGRGPLRLQLPLQAIRGLHGLLFLHSQPRRCSLYSLTHRAAPPLHLLPQAPSVMTLTIPGAVAAATSVAASPAIRTMKVHLRFDQPRNRAISAGGVTAVVVEMCGDELISLSKEGKAGSAGRRGRKNGEERRKGVNERQRK